jgi:tRNA(fMet)-specific endonuclease VapC
MYALDTNTVIFFKTWVMLPHLFSEIALPSVVLYELEVGIAKSTAPEKRRTRLNELLTVVRVLPFTEHEAAISTQV